MLTIQAEQLSLMHTHVKEAMDTTRVRAGQLFFEADAQINKD